MGQRRRRARRACEGMTLVEIMVVIVIMTLIASAVGVAVFRVKVRADEHDARIGAATVDGAAMVWMTQHDVSACPTTHDLVADGVLAHNRRTTDPWGHEYAIACGDDGAIATSAGRDGQLGTEDDQSATTRSR